ncbi:MFS transporter [Actinosynnema sp. ALI-1.44]|uniref:MFS transporter n=1 Tax=Actinosynnema sp. ALI-1.44 TaxID=1933779 RepID=UPI00097C245C|nr:MFS transporter [Actinosynnema sp. ALI-1.44]ONI82909.1 MFS transporter [Actinosynnema sp. ALI-1.44]
MSLALVAMALSAFVMGTAEFVITGLLPEVAVGLEVSIPTAGLLISGYALAVVIGGPLCIAAGTRLPHRAMLLMSMGLFVLGNLVCAVAPGYAVLMAGRVLAAFGQAAFLGIGSVVAANLVEPRLRSRAIAMVFTGITVANVFGSPLGTLVGQNLGWRATFWIITAIALATTGAVAALVPAQPKPTGGGLRGELAVFGLPQVWLTLAITTLGMGALFASFSYVAPLLTQVTGYSSGALTLLLALYGVGLVAGNLLGGWFADRAQLATLFGGLAALTVVLTAFAAFADAKIPATILLVLMGAAGFALVPAFMTRLIDKADGAPTLAAAAGGSAANLGTSIGAYAGGLTISAGMGYTAPTVLGAVMAALGLGVAVFAAAVERRKQPTPA